MRPGDGGQRSKARRLTSRRSTRPKATDLVAQVRSVAGMLKHVRKSGRTGLTDDEAVLRAVAADDARIRAYARKRRRK